MKKKETNQQKWDLLEKVVEQLCQGIKNAVTKRNIRIIGKNGKRKRQIDVLIDGKMWAFNVRIVVEAKNYTAIVWPEKVEALVTKLKDVGGNMWAIVSRKWFTQTAKNIAIAEGIQLFEAFDPSLWNSPWLLPLRSIKADVTKFAFGFSSAWFPIRIPTNYENILFYVGGKVLTYRQIAYYAWNEDMIPHTKWEHIAHFDSIKFIDIERPTFDQFCQLEIRIVVEERYFLKLFPVSFLKNSGNENEHHTLKIDDYMKESDLLLNWWKKYNTREELDKAADIENQPNGLREFIIQNDFSYDIDHPSW